MTDWKIVKLGSLLVESKIISKIPDPNRRLRVKLNIQGVEKRPELNDKGGATKYYTRRAGQFIYGKQNLHKGAFGVIPNEFDGFESSSDIPAFDVDDSCYPEWIFYFFRRGNFYLRLESLAKGVGSKRINLEQLSHLEISLPDKEIQKKILYKIALIENKYDYLIKEFKRQESLLFKLRESFLQEVFQGKKTASWRLQNSKQLSGVELLENIQKQRLNDKKKIKKETSVPMIVDNEIPFEIPANWSWVRLQDLITDLRYGTSKKCDYELGETNVIRIPNILSNGRIDIKDLKSAHFSETEKKDLDLREDDILIIRSNGSKSLVGRCAVVKDLSPNYSFAGYLVRIRPLNDYILSDFIYWAFESKYFRDKIEKPLRDSSGVKNINSSEIYKFVIPLCSIEEQKIVLNTINKFNDYYNKVRQEVTNNRSDLEQLVQSLLLNLMGNNVNALAAKLPPSKKPTLIDKRIQIYDAKTTLMDFKILLKKYGKLHAEDLWKMSNFPNDIDAFYAELKKQIETEKSIKEVENEKGYLELI